MQPFFLFLFPFFFPIHSMLPVNVRDVGRVGLNALEDLTQRSEGLVDGGSLQQAIARSLALGHALRACQVH